MSDVEQMATNMLAYFKERSNVLLDMDMCIEKRMRLDELNKAMTAFQVQLQRIERKVS